MARRDRDKYYRSLALTRQIEAFRNGHGELEALDAIISRNDVAISAKLEAIDIALSRGIVTAEELASSPRKPEPLDFGVTLDEGTPRRFKFLDHSPGQFPEHALLVAWLFSAILMIWYLYDRTNSFFLSLTTGFLLSFAPIMIFGFGIAIVVRSLSYLGDKFIPSRIAKRRFDAALKSHSTLVLAREIKSFEGDVALYKTASGREFERLVARAYSKSGYDVVEVGGANDGGVDLIVSKAGIKAIVQCKAHARAISPAVVRELYGTLTHANATIAILASTNGPSDNAREWARDKSIRFVSPDDLILGRL